MCLCPPYSSKGQNSRKRNRWGLHSCKADVVRARVGGEAGTGWPWNREIRKAMHNMMWS